MSEKVVDFEPGSAGKSQLLHEALIKVIWDGQFDDMTVAEILGTLELVKLDVALGKKS